MQDFKKFIIQIQTLTISRDDIYAINGGGSFFELKEFALTDILNQPEEQIFYQIQRLELIRQLFTDFWANHDTIPDYTREVHPATYFACLELESYFKIVEQEKIPHADLSYEFIDQLLRAIRERMNLLSDFIWSIENAVKRDAKADIDSKDDEKLIQDKFKSIPVFKSEIVPELFDLLKAYFAQKDQDLLLDLLQGAAQQTEQKIMFHGNGNQLADAFKQLTDANLIVGCNKAELSVWIRKYFSYKDKTSQKSYTEKYLNDIISSDTKTCQSPILDIKKRENGQYGVFPTQRIKKNYKKY
ncbi:MAG TPA: hypothetical protein VN721_11430 [Flavipsychrobacter sp.]|nr:hypothetical protein [Flavipsychrobacter sp.]